MSTVRVERCPECQAMIGEGTLYEHQQRAHKGHRKHKPLNLDVSKEWCERMANLEEGHDISAGSLASMKNEACRHRDCWILGTMGLWCYRCGAYRPMTQVPGKNALRARGRWIRPVGPTGKNPYDKAPQEQP